MGRCALHTTRSLAVSHATSAASPVSTSSCCNNLHPRMARPATWTFPLQPVVGAMTSSCLDSQMQCMWAGVSSGSRLTWPNIAWRCLVILSQTLSWTVRFMMVALVTKSYQRIPSIRRWHDMLNASSFCSSFFSSVQVCTVQKDRDDKSIVQSQR